MRYIKKHRSIIIVALLVAAIFSGCIESPSGALTEEESKELQARIAMYGELSDALEIPAQALADIITQWALNKIFMDYVGEILPFGVGDGVKTALGQMTEEEDRISKIEVNAKMSNTYSVIAINVAFHESGYISGLDESKLRSDYNNAGLFLSVSDRTMPDRVSKELKMMQVLVQKEYDARKAGNAADGDRWQEAQRNFLQNHLLKWVPCKVENSLCNKMKDHFGKNPPDDVYEKFYEKHIIALDSWLQIEENRLTAPSKITGDVIAVPTKEIEPTVTIMPTITTPSSAQISELTGATAIAVSGGSGAITSGYTVLLKQDGTVWAWGHNEYGQLGDGTTTNRLNANLKCNREGCIPGDGTTPVQVSGLKGVTAIAAGGGHTVALKNDGTVWAWGSNDHGLLGDGTTTDRYAPVQVSGLTGVTAIAASGTHTVALKNDGTVWVWGLMIPDDATTPVQVPGLTGVTAIAAGSFTVALKNDGTVWMFAGVKPEKAIQVRELTGVTAIAADGTHMVALKNDGTIWERWILDFSLVMK